jgi:hypothetical protein
MNVKLIISVVRRHVWLLAIALVALDWGASHIFDFQPEVDFLHDTFYMSEMDGSIALTQLVNNFRWLDGGWHILDSLRHFHITIDYLPPSLSPGASKPATHGRLKTSH